MAWPSLAVTRSRVSWEGHRRNVLDPLEYAALLTAARRDGSGTHALAPLPANARLLLESQVSAQNASSPTCEGCLHAARLGREKHWHTADRTMIKRIQTGSSTLLPEIPSPASASPSSSGTPSPGHGREASPRNTASSTSTATTSSSSCRPASTTRDHGGAFPRRHLVHMTRQPAFRWLANRPRNLPGRIKASIT